MDANKETEIIERLARLETKLDTFTSDITLCTNMCNDNKNKLVLLENKIENQNNAIRELRDRNLWLARTSIGAVISSIGAIVVMFIKIAVGG